MYSQPASPTTSSKPPPPRVRPSWFYASDVVKYNPTSPDPSNRPRAAAPAPATKPAVVWEKFSVQDSARLEAMYQKLDKWRNDNGIHSTILAPIATTLAHPLLADEAPVPQPPSLTPPFATTVMLGEDQLFEVDVDLMIRYSLYWQNPIWEVCRTYWFANTGPSGKFVPCNASLNRQLELGFHKIKPWTFIPPPNSLSNNGPVNEQSLSLQTSPNPWSAKPVDHRYPLLGAYLSKYVVFQDSHAAMMRDDNALTKLQLGVASAALAMLGNESDVLSVGTKLIRGWDRLPQVIKERELAELAAAKANSKTGISPTSPPSVQNSPSTANPPSKPFNAPPMSKFTELTAELTDTDAPDYPVPDQVPPVDHLVLVLHGIGSKFSETSESFSFVSDCHHLRTGVSNSLKPNDTKPVRVMLLPIHWRQSIKFATHHQPSELSDSDSDSDLDSMDGIFMQSRRHSVADASQPEPKPKVMPEKSSSSFSTAVASLSADSVADDPRHVYHLPSLDEIMLQQVPAIRTLIVDVLMDVLLFMSTKFKAEILKVSAQEINRVYALFCARHPTFKGKVSIIGHSLGSVITFELLTGTPIEKPTMPVQDPGSVPHVEQYRTLIMNQKLRHSSTSPSLPIDTAPNPANATITLDLNSYLTKPEMAEGPKHDRCDALDFPVDCFFTMGSPLGYFLLLHGQRLRAATRTNRNPDLIKRPKCRAMYNLFSPYDPVAVRLEPFISRSLVAKDPVKIPYTKGGITQVKHNVESTVHRTVDALSAMLPSWTMAQQQPVLANLAVVTSPGNFPGSAKSSPTDQPNDRPASDKYSRRKRRVEARERLDGVSVLNARFGRLDFALQHGVLDNQYLAALSTHMAYWTDPDVSGFIAKQVALSVEETVAPKADASCASWHSAMDHMP